MSMPTSQEAIWSVVLQCASERLHKRCTSNFNSNECNNCKWNVHNYFDVDPRKVNLLMLHAEGEMSYLIIKEESEKKLRRQQAEDEVYDLQLGKNKAKKRIIYLILFIVAVIVGIWWYGNGQYQYGLEAPTKGVIETRYSDDESAVWNTLRKVAVGMTKKTDVNSDGKVNCIDAALLFYKYYPYKDRVTIEYNYNPSKDFNHMFNAILIGGNWIAVEPQAKFCGYDVYRMKPIWGNQYEWTLNRDVTKEWLKYVR